jgi:hypothetical protein
MAVIVHRIAALGEIDLKSLHEAPDVKRALG